MSNKALVINVQGKSVPQGVPNKWEGLTSQMPTFTKDIITPALQEGTDTSALVSGVPTVFARATLFGTALQYGTTGENSSALNIYYETLVDEWRGLIACIALDSNAIDVRQIKLAYSDGKSVRDTINPYEPKGAFGNMLFYRRNAWCPQRAAQNAQTEPVINVIKIDGQVVAGTSPDTLLFTAPNYHLKAGKAYVNVYTGKFTDPQKSSLTSDQWLALYAYVDNLLQKIPSLANYYTPAEGGRPLVDYSCVTNNLEQWLNEISQNIERKGIDLAKASALPVNLFSEPFGLVFNFTDELYGYNGKITQKGDFHGIAFNPENLLLEKGSQIARIPLGSDYEKNPDRLTDLSIYVLKADKTGQDGYAFFALPLSGMGIKVFGRNIGTVLGQDQSGVDVKSRITAHFDEPTNTLNVTLTLAIDEGKSKTINVSYPVKPEIIRRKDILLWPNFISKQWNRYFLYSELPHNVHSEDCPFRAEPFVGDETAPAFDVVCDEDGSFIYLAQDGKASKDEHVAAQLHILADHRVSDSNYQYEIYESSHPFKGVRLTSTGKNSGFILIRYSDKISSRIPYYGLDGQVELHDACLGIDFGSTNTSVAYYDMVNKEDATGLDFKDLRISLLCDMHDDHKAPTIENSIFFFQGTQVHSNAVKSILALQDERRYPQEQGKTPDALRKKEISGGFPCFCKNLPVANIEKDKIGVQFINGTGISATLIHNMKWSDQESDKAHKTAFLSSLLLQIYAQLFTNGVVPVKLNWSYPSAMSDSLVRDYDQIWSNLGNISPVMDWNSNIKKLTVTQWKAGIVDINDGWENDNIASSNDGWGNSGDFSASVDDGWGSASNRGWGDPSSSGNGWDNAKSADNGWDEKPKAKATVVDLKPDGGPIDFNFKTVEQESCQTEACAVANYLSTSSKIDTNVRTLTLCFDVGGSTTDISAICMMRGADGQPHKAMIKQNSIRFAAQRISNATRSIPTFKKVLEEICQRYNLRILGFNMGPNTYSQDTAPYFYEQIVDNLSPEQLEDFYRCISAYSPELFSVNLYVTGLIMYYAGQLTNKLVQEVRRSKDGPGTNWTPQVQVVFAGKGSRIFEWFSCTNNERAFAYSKEMFIHGIGGMDKAKSLLCGWPIIHLNDRSSTDNKFEVSKGLAMAALQADDGGLMVPGDNRAIEILGEEGFSIRTKDSEEVALEFDNSITTQFMEYLGTYFMPPMSADGKPTCKRFMDFTNVFFTYASRLYRLDQKVTKEDFMKGFMNMNIGSYIKALPEYRKALQEKAQHGFDFVAPIIIIEGMKFYDEVLLPKLNRNS